MHWAQGRPPYPSPASTAAPGPRTPVLASLLFRGKKKERSKHESLSPCNGDARGCFCTINTVMGNGSSEGSGWYTGRGSTLSPAAAEAPPGLEVLGLPSGDIPVDISVHVFIETWSPEVLHGAEGPGLSTWPQAQVPTLLSAREGCGGRPRHPLGCWMTGAVADADAPCRRWPL